LSCPHPVLVKAARIVLGRAFSPPEAGGRRRDSGRSPATNSCPIP
jgi:hypothetical protein